MLNPASRIVALLGGPQTTAELAGVHISRVFRWTYPKARGGTGGLVPARHQQRLLDQARARGIALEPEDFFRRSSVEERDTGERSGTQRSADSTHPEIEFSKRAESRSAASKSDVSAEGAA